MYYELDADCLWLLNFVMNLYLLILVDRTLMRTATRMRIILSAAVGAAAYLLPFLWVAPVWIKLPAGVITGTALMVFIAFRPGSARAYVNVLERLSLYSFLLGGLLLFLTGTLPLLRERPMGVCGVLGLGAVGSLLVGRLQSARRARERKSTCRATLLRNGNALSVDALLDSGNSLVEPISGKPVAVIDEELYRGLWREEDVPYRAVPYTSVGKRRGILRGYRLPELRVEVDGIEKRFQDVYVAVSSEYAGSVRMILNPALLENKEG